MQGKLPIPLPCESEHELRAGARKRLPGALALNAQGVERQPLGAVVPVNRSRQLWPRREPKPFQSKR